MSSDSKMLQCYNRSCGQVFDPEQNTSESCMHHSGLPVFHDAYKKWSCCEKKTTDFTEFLNIKGCTKSYHSNIKPQEPPKTQNKIVTEESIRPPLQRKETFVRPDENQPLIHVPSTIGASLKPLLEKMQNETTVDNDVENDLVVKLNTPCLNKGCRQVYKGEHTNTETCLHHSGVPIFHEGMKYWSCCVKRTSDFDSFLEQIGCSMGQHKWHKDNECGERAMCRYDWHQTGNLVVVSIYSKCPFPNLSYVEANPVKLHIHITFGEKKSVFDEEMVLFGGFMSNNKCEKCYALLASHINQVELYTVAKTKGEVTVVDVSDSLVTYLGSKVEIKLKKAGPAPSWKDLSLLQNNQNDCLPGIGSISLKDSGDK